MSEVLKISLPGVDVRTARPEQCAVHSDYPSPKIKKGTNPAHRGLINLVLNSTYAFGTTTLYTFPHGYSYTPMVWATIANTTTPNIFGFQPYVNGLFAVDVRADAANVYVVAIVSTLDQSSLTPLVTLNISYAVFAENGAHN